MLSLTEENYLKTIFVLNQDEESSATTNAIAQKLDTKASSVSDMLKKLKQKQLIHYKKYQAVSLTDPGAKEAVAIIRKHRLWEFFLVEKLDFKWDEVHDVAEQLEHIKSKKLTDQLDAFLGHPKFDPHGDPIPNKNGVFPTKLSRTLSHLNEGETAKVIGVKDHSKAFLGYLEQLKIDLGTEIKLNQIVEFDQSLEIEINQNQKASISQDVALNLFIE